MSDVKKPVSVTMPLYRWLMLIGALANLPDQSWWTGLVDLILDEVKP